MPGNLGSLGSLFIDVAANTASFETDIGRSARLADRAARDMQRRIGTATAAITASFAAVGLASVAAFSRLNTVVNDVANFKGLSEQIGDTAAAVASLKPVSDVSGVALETVAASSVKLTAALSKQVEESDGAAAAIRAIGLDFDAFKRTTPVKQLEQVAARFAQFRDDAGKTAVAVALFGRSGAELIPFLNDLNDIGERKNTLDGLGIDNADEYVKQLDRTRGQVSSLAQNYAIQMIPSLRKVAILQQELLKPENIERAQKLADGLIKVAEFASKGALATAEFIAGLGEGLAAQVVGISGDAGRLTERISELRKELERFQQTQARTDPDGNRNKGLARTISERSAEIAALEKQLSLIQQYSKPAPAPAAADARGSLADAAEQIRLAEDQRKIEEEKQRRLADAALRAAADADRAREQQLQVGIAAEEAGRQAVEAARRTLEVYDRQAKGIGELTKAQQLQFDIERGQYRELDEFTKRRLGNIAKEIEAAEKLATASQQRQETARALVGQFSPGKTGNDFLTQLGTATSGDQIGGIVGSARGSENERFAAELDAFQASREEILAMGADYYALLAEAATAHQQELTRIEQGGIAARASLQQQQVIAAADAFASIADAALVFGRKGFAIYKAAAIASTIIGTYDAAQAASASAAKVPVIGPALSVAAAAAQVTLGFARVSQIRSQNIGSRRFGGPVAAGGVYEVAEPGNPELIKYGSKTILAMGSQPGSVMPAKAASAAAMMAGARGAGGNMVRIENYNTQSDTIRLRTEQETAADGSLTIRTFTEALEDNTSPISRGISRKAGVRATGRIG